jgi:hypothetical protein
MVPASSSAFQLLLSTLNPKTINHQETTPRAESPLATEPKRPKLWVDPFSAKVLAAALKKPQFVFRDGEVFVIRRVVLTDVPDSGEGDMARVIADTWDKLGPAPQPPHPRNPRRGV